ncbi:TM2 domain-containing protein [Mycoplasmopsis arginini]|uniref:TM2 domain-containing protein n=1 Tax=Mycoplasmopsis arginini TaxID=2094 RepID=A0AA43TW10_MYCAR|nr:TM2 domain-containing protein [Mycoplasmopsis arginini]MCY2902728.1 TM2 domain-containing protein [Mycoplasmopsis arginini QMP CG1-2758]MDI3348348.1 TM2 domain-containing protein [Mycoplasmopsis arginini]MDI3349298.1 TM2 domain-containing protein [Mycoplasmopsis arginini]MDI3350187.1 TM2 domain-containing protein [Mycoplasmopsis arginini]MDI3351029.1 TM2 domain-containing protein [Mycoplasmopsis arginini]
MSEKSRTILTLLSFFLGGLGIDRFYGGRIILGVLKLLTAGGFGIWALVDFILAVCGAQRDGQGQLIRKW